MSFATPQFGSIIIITVTVALCLFLVQTIRAMRQFEHTSFWVSHTQHARRRAANHVRYSVTLIAVILMALALLRPVWGENTITQTEGGVNIFIALDVSKSMRAVDISVAGRTIDRLTEAKLAVADLVRRHPEHRYGLILFAGETFISSPLTSDVASFISFLDQASDESVRIQGTNLTEAIRLALNHFPADSQRGNAILLISDGSDEVPKDLPAVLEEAKHKSVKIFTVGVGGQRPAPIPEVVDIFGSVRYKTHNGRMVYTKLNESTLREIAETTGGTYVYLANDPSRIEKIAAKLRRLPSAQHSETKHVVGAERFAVFLIPSLLCFLFAVGAPLISGLPKRRNKK